MKLAAARWFRVGACALTFVSGARAQDVAAGPPDSAALDANAARKAEAEQCRLRALTLYDAGDYAAARTEFAHANQLLPSYRLLYNLGVVSLDLADPASAYDYFERFLAEGGELIPPEKRSEALRQLRELALRIATVTVFADKPGAEILIDEKSAGASPSAIRLNPGTHRIAARSGGESTQTKLVELSGGDSLRLELRFPAASARARSNGPQRQIFWRGWAGTAGLTAGAVLAGFEALSTHHEYQQQYGTITSRAELNRLDRNATRWSVTADTLGGAAILLGAYSLYMSLRHTPLQASGASGFGKFSVRVVSNQARVTVSF